MDMKKRFVVSLALALIAVFVGITAEGAQKGVAVQRDESLRRGETRTTVDPNFFTDARVRKAYQVAKEIPWVLDSIYCYCKCEESPAFRHKSLLSCYVDNHAAL